LRELAFVAANIALERLIAMRSYVLGAANAVLVK
jgi:hypothetical protein